MRYADSAPTDHSVTPLCRTTSLYLSWMCYLLLLQAIWPERSPPPPKKLISLSKFFLIIVCVCARFIKHIYIILCSWPFTFPHSPVWICPSLHVQPHAWTNVNSCMYGCVWKREGVCVCTCVCSRCPVFCSSRLAGLCCCSLVQTGLATCSPVCQYKPRLHRFNLSIAAAKGPPSCPMTLFYSRILTMLPFLPPSHLLCLSVAMLWTKNELAYISSSSVQNLFPFFSFLL